MFLRSGDGRVSLTTRSRSESYILSYFLLFSLPPNTALEAVYHHGAIGPLCLVSLGYCHGYSVSACPVLRFAVKWVIQSQGLATN